MGTMRRNILPTSAVLTAKLFIVFLFVLLLAGCFCLGGASLPEEQYSLDYPSPKFEGLSSINEVIKMNQFVEAKEFRDATMVYSPSPLKRDAYSSAWWSASPGDIITDFLLRDLRSSGLFRAVFSYRDDADARLILNGGVEEFLEVDGNGGPKAVLALNVTLLDLNQKDMVKRVVFQKTFRETQSMEIKSPQALARGMSIAMEKVSRELQKDIYEAIKNLDKPR
jgi:ABC-type uncharacterized transport system auxiliary subunit